MFEFPMYAANPDSEAACEKMGQYRKLERALNVAAITLALIVMVSMVMPVDSAMWGPILHIGYILNLVLAGVGSGLLSQVVGRAALARFIRGYLRGGSILRLDHSIISLQVRYDALGREIPLADDDRFGIQRDFNALLETRCGDKAPGI